MNKLIDKYLGLLKLGRIDRELMHYTRELKGSGRTFLSYLQLASLAENFVRLRQIHKDGLQVAEFGVGRGGSAMLLARLVQRYGGQLVLYDVFARIPAPSTADGQAAQNRYQTILEAEDGSYYGNIPDLLQVIKDEIAAVCSLDKVTFHQGLYEALLPQLDDRYRFHLVHVDCDWYESARTVLQYLHSRLESGAVLQIDDYYYWQGARKATDEAAWLNGYQRKQIEGALVLDLAKRN